MLRWRARVGGAYKASLHSLAVQSLSAQLAKTARSSTTDGCKAFFAALREVPAYAGVRTFPFLWNLARHRLGSAGVRGRPAKIKIRAPKRRRAATSRQEPKARVARQPARQQQSQQSTMAETVFAMVQRQEQERREAIARGEPDPFLVKEPEEPAREPNRLEKFEAWMATDWEFGPYYWEEGQERPEQLKERLRQRFWWLYEKNLRGAEFVGEVVANLFGLTESKYQWVIDAQRDEERREKQRKLEDSQRRMLAERALAEREATEAAARREQGDVEHCGRF